MEKKETLLALIAEKADLDVEEITTESTFADLGLDSLDRVELVMEMETTFTIVITDEDMEKFNTVGDVIKYLEGDGK